MNTRLTSLSEIEAAVWAELTAAVRDKAHAWRTPALATVGTLDGEPVAEARTVVLREVNAEAQRFVIYGDTRSAKFEQLAQRPLGTLLFWSRDLSWQLRCRARFEVLTEGLELASRWARLRLSPAAQDYLSPLPPGAPLPDAPVDAVALPIERGHFGLLSAQVTALDWLELHADGHRRARFGAEGAAWLQP
jgi:hypothetical protein